MAKPTRWLLATAAALALAAPASANTLKWGANRDIGSLDPYSFGDTFTLAVLNHVYEGLVRYNDELKIEPALAESWEISDDGRTWRFHLRKGVKFHNSNDLTADDVLASLARVSHETSPLKGNLPAYESSAKVDDHTVDIVVNTTYPLLLNDLTNIHIFDKEWLVENNALVPTDAGAGVEGYPTNNANGTGPFRVEERLPDARTTFVVNRDWWDEPRHNLTRIEFIPITSHATRVAALLSGEINFTNLAPLQDLPRLEAAPNVDVLLTTELRTVFYLFNMRDELVDSDIKGKNPFLDRRVRAAMYHALAGDQIQQKVMRGLSRTTGSLVAPAIPGYVPELDERLPYDPDKAKALLAEAGYPDGFRFSFLCTSDSYVNEEELCQATAAMWARVGLKPSLHVGPRSVLNPKRVGGEWDVTIIGWANEPMIDSYSILIQVLHSKTGTAGVFNWGSWGGPEIDRLTDQAATELDTAARLPLQTAALKIAHDEVMFLPLHQQPMAWATGADVESVVQLPDNKPRHWYTRMR